MAKNKSIVFFGAILFYLYFRGIGDHGLIDPVEGINASISMHMYAGGNYLAPKIGESFTAGKSMGTWWFTAMALKIFGWGEFAVRFWSALAGLGMILASALSARSDDKRSSWLAACVCAGMTLCFVVSQISSSHAMYSCLTGLAMTEIIRSVNNRRSLIFAHVFITLAFIMHGPEGLILPFLSVIIYCVLSEDWDMLRNFLTWPGGIVFTILFCGLYFVMFMLLNPSVIHFMRCQDHVYTFGGIWGIVIFAFVGFVPWHGFIIRAIWEVLPRKYPAEKGNEFFMLVWSMTFATFAILSEDILSLGSCIPALSSLVGRRLDLWLGRKNLRSVNIAVILDIIILVPVLYLVLPFMTNVFPVIGASMLSLIPWGILTGAFIFACWYYTRTKQVTKWVRNVPAVALLCLMPLAGVFNLVAEMYSVRDIGIALQGIIQGSDKVIQYGINFPSVYFYSLRNSLLIDTDFTPGVEEKKLVAKYSVINDLWRMNERVFLIMPQDKRPENPLPQNMFHVFEANGMLLLSNK